jgi:hypothetical protein
MEANGSKSFIENGAKCIHANLEPSYGFAGSSGWRGIGVGYWCADCHAVPRFYDDTELCSKDEIEYNKNKRESTLEIKAS